MGRLLFIAATLLMMGASAARANVNWYCSNGVNCMSVGTEMACSDGSYCMRVGSNFWNCGTYECNTMGTLEQCTNGMTCTISGTDRGWHEDARE